MLEGQRGWATTAATGGTIGAACTGAPDVRTTYEGVTPGRCGGATTRVRQGLATSATRSDAAPSALEAISLLHISAPTSQPFCTQTASLARSGGKAHMLEAPTGSQAPLAVATAGPAPPLAAASARPSPRCSRRRGGTRPRRSRSWSSTRAARGGAREARRQQCSCGRPPCSRASRFLRRARTSGWTWIASNFNCRFRQHVALSRCPW